MSIKRAAITFFGFAMPLVAVSTAFGITADEASELGEIWDTNKVYTAQQVDEKISGMASDYDDLDNLPKINGVTLIGDKSGNDLGVLDLGGGTMTGELTVPNLTVGSRLIEAEVGINSVAEGSLTAASGDNSHAEGYRTSAIGENSHTEGEYSMARNQSEHAQGQYNVSHKASDDFGDGGNTIDSIGIGTTQSGRRNAVETMQDGKTYIYGLGGYDGTNPTNAIDLASMVNSKASDSDIDYSTNNTELVETIHVTAPVPNNYANASMPARLRMSQPEESEFVEPMSAFSSYVFDFRNMPGRPGVVFRNGVFYIDCEYGGAAGDRDDFEETVRFYLPDAPFEYYEFDYEMSPVSTLQKIEMTSTELDAVIESNRVNIATNSADIASLKTNKADKTELSGYLPLTGGTMTGPLVVESIESNISVGQMDSGADLTIGHLQHAPQLVRINCYGAIHIIDSTTGDSRCSVQIPYANGTLALAAPDPTEGHLAALDADGNPVDSGVSATNYYTKRETDAAISAASPADYATVSNRAMTALQSYTETDPVFESEKSSLATKSELLDYATHGYVTDKLSDYLNATTGGRVSGDLSVAGELSVDGELGTSSDITVGGNLYLHGDSIVIGADALRLAGSSDGKRFVFEADNEVDGRAESRLTPDGSPVATSNMVENVSSGKADKSKQVLSEPFWVFDTTGLILYQENSTTWTNGVENYLEYVDARQAYKYIIEGYGEGLCLGNEQAEVITNSTGTAYTFTRLYGATNYYPVVYSDEVSEFAPVKSVNGMEGSIVLTGSDIAVGDSNPNTVESALTSTAYISGSTLDNYNATSTGNVIFFRSRAFGMRDGDYLKSITVRTSSSLNNNAPAVYARIVDYGVSPNTTIAVSAPCPMTNLNEDVTFYFPSLIQLNDKARYYKIEFSTTDSAEVGTTIMTSTALRIYNEGDGIRHTDCYFYNSLYQPVMKIEYYGSGNPVLLDTDNCISNGTTTYHSGSALAVEGSLTILSGGTIVLQSWDQLRLSSGQTLPQYIAAAISASTGNIALNTSTASSSSFDMYKVTTNDVMQAVESLPGSSESSEESEEDDGGEQVNFTLPD